MYTVFISICHTCPQRHTNTGEKIQNFVHSNYLCFSPSAAEKAKNSGFFFINIHKRYVL